MTDLTDALPQPFEIPAGTGTRGQRSNGATRWLFNLPNGRWATVAQAAPDAAWTLTYGPSIEPDLTVEDVNDRLATIAAEETAP